MDDKLKQYIDELLILALEGIARDDQIDQLNNLIRSNREVQEYCSSFIELSSFLYMPDQLSMQFVERDLVESKEYIESLQELEYLEETASVVHIEKEPLEPIVCEKTTANSAVSQNKFFRIYNKLISVAAVLLLMFILYANIFPPKYTIEVATIADQVNVKWDHSSGKLDMKSRVLTNQPPYKIESGFIKLVYDQGVDVLIEGPAEFEVEREGIYLEYGRIYAKVTQVGQGFTVDSKAAKFVDLGTEFGVHVEKNGTSEVHVIDGTVQLYAGLKDSNKITRTISENYAMRFDAGNNILESVPVSQEIFARNINTQSGTVWRGQKVIDLADIIGGGDGFGKGKIGTGIDPRTGKYLKEPTIVNFPRVPNVYTKVSLPFIDGVFVPNGIENVVINSNNDTYDGFEETRGDYRIAIMNGPAIRDRKKYPDRAAYNAEFYLHDLSLNGITYGTKKSPAIYMHSNVGITYDLNHIRSMYPGKPKMSFSSFCGIPDEVIKLSSNGSIKTKKVNLNLYIFLDNECVLKKSLNDSSPVADLNIPVPIDSEFLCIVVTDHDRTSDYDWCILGRPTLNIE